MNPSTPISLAPRAASHELREAPLGDVLAWIGDPPQPLATLIEDYRSAPSPEKKQALPAAMFSGRFHRRAREGLADYSGVLCMDFDHLTDAPADRDRLRGDPYVLSAFLSPGEQGLKVLLPVPGGPTSHKRAWEAADAYLRGSYGLEADRSGKDLTRLCFLSHDPEMLLQWQAIPLPVDDLVAAEPEAREAPRSPSVAGDRPGDRYNAAADVYDRSLRILLARGWQVFRELPDRTYLTRPGKDRGVSGTLWHTGAFYSFTDATDLEPAMGYSPFGLYAFHHHGGDHTVAARHLARSEFPPVTGKEPDPSTAPPSADPSKTIPAGPGLSKDADSAPGGLPPILRASEAIPEDLSRRLAREYPILIDQILHRSTKAIVASTSKAGKTWLGLDIATSVATGTPWMGLASRSSEVLYINLEIPEAFLFHRLQKLAFAKKLSLRHLDQLHLWNLRGKATSAGDILGALSLRPDLIVLDPVYKLLRGRDENSAGEMQLFMAEIELLMERTGAAVLFIHHFSKGNKSDSSPLDRASGSGVFARDPDTILTLTEHEEDEHFVIECSLRNFPPVAPWVVRREFPLFHPATEQSPRRLRRPGQKITPNEALQLIRDAGATGLPATDFISRLVDEWEVHKSTAYRLKDRLIARGQIHETRRHLFLSHPSTHN
mgnify:CR=1 FL=1